MNKKIGKFKLWQLLAVGGILGVIIYEYEKGKTPSEANPESELVASNANPLAGSGGESGFGGLNDIPPAPGAPGEPGPPGPPSAPFELTASERQEIAGEAAAMNVGLTKAGLKPAAMSSKFPQTNPATGKKYKTVKEHGKTIHVYQDGHRVVTAAKKVTHRAGNPNHKPSHAAPVKPINHSRPAPLKAPAKTPSHKPGPVSKARSKARI